MYKIFSSVIYIMSSKPKYVYIDPSLDNELQLIEELNNNIKKNKKIFMFIFMDGCMPCNQAKPQWLLIEEFINSHSKYNDVIIVLINQVLFPKLLNAGFPPTGFPTFRYIHDNNVEEYNDSRNTDDFIKWINSKTNQKGGRSKHISRKNCRNKKYITKRKTTKKRMNKKKTTKRKL